RPISPGLSSASVPTAISSTCRSKLSLPQRSRKPSAEPHAHRPPRRIPASLIGHGGPAPRRVDSTSPFSAKSSGRGWSMRGRALAPTSLRRPSHRIRRREVPVTLAVPIDLGGEDLADAVAGAVAGAQAIGVPKADDGTDAEVGERHGPVRPGEGLVLSASADAGGADAEAHGDAREARKALEGEPVRADFGASGFLARVERKQRAKSFGRR